MNVHSLSNRINCHSLEYSASTCPCFFGPPVAVVWRAQVASPPQNRHPERFAGTPLSRFRMQVPFHSVVRDDRRWLHPQCQTINRKPARLLDKLPDRDNRAQNTHHINRSFQQVPVLFFRANQERVCSWTIHRCLILSSKDAAGFRFCLTRLSVEDSCLASNIGCDDEMDWIQINPQLFNSFPPDARYLVGVSGARHSTVLHHHRF